LKEVCLQFLRKLPMLSSRGSVFKPHLKQIFSKEIGMNDRTNEAGCIVIGEGVTVSGKFVVPGRAVINGSLEGDLQADEILVGAQGKLVGNIKVRKADVYGEVHDTLLASEHLIIRSTGRVNGNASYGEIEIERGGLVQGAIVPAKAVVAIPAVLQPADLAVVDARSQV
jgi:cytoskeletal protein CcmA (bactofilin family)